MNRRSFLQVTGIAALAALITGKQDTIPTQEPLIAIGTQEHYDSVINALHITPTQPTHTGFWYEDTNIPIGSTPEEIQRIRYQTIRNIYGKERADQLLQGTNTSA